MKNLRGEAEIEALFEGRMHLVAEALDDMLNPDQKGPDRQVGFVLIVYPMHATEGNCSLISNSATKSDLTMLMRQLIERFETT